MRTAILTAVVALLGTACYSSAPDRYYVRGDHARTAAFDAQTNDGDFVRVQQDSRGDLYIIDPVQLRGQRVAMVNPDTGSGVALVTTDTGPRRQYREGSGGDQNDRREPDRR